MSKHSLINQKDFFSETADDFFPLWNEWFRKNRFFNQVTIPPLNISDDKDLYKVTVAVPGLEKGDFNIDLEGNLLTINAESEKEHEEEKKKYRRKEYSYSGFSRSFTLPSDVNTDGIEAAYENGILSVKLPRNDKTGSTKERKIEVK